MANNTNRTGAIRKATFGRDMRAPIADSLVLTKSKADSDLDAVVARHEEQIKSANASQITGSDSDYSLVFSTSN